jgi:hypothetical protein
LRSRRWLRVRALDISRPKQYRLLAGPARARVGRVTLVAKVDRAAGSASCRRLRTRRAWARLWLSVQPSTKVTRGALLRLCDAKVRVVREARVALRARLASDVVVEVRVGSVGADRAAGRFILIEAETHRPAEAVARHLVRVIADLHVARDTEST